MTKTKKVKNIVKEDTTVAKTNVPVQENENIIEINDEVSTESTEVVNEDKWENFKEYETEKGVYDFTDAPEEVFNEASNIVSKEDKVMVGEEAVEFDRKKKIERNRMISYTWNGQVYDF